MAAPCRCHAIATARCRSASWYGAARWPTTRCSTPPSRSKPPSRREPPDMRIAVIGAGIVGVTTAFELAGDGHEVTVYERRGSVAAETSFANAGVVAPGYVTPWAAPDMPSKVLRSLFEKHGAVRLNARMDAAMLGWMWRW